VQRVTPLRLHQQRFYSTFNNHLIM